jgi:mycothiol synthase
VETLTASERDAVGEIVAAARDVDGVGPLSDQALVELARPGQHLLADGGYAHLDGTTAEVVVSPDHRRRGIGRALVGALRARTGGPLEVWAHGDSPAAQGFALALGLARSRVLWQLHRPATDPLPAVTWPDGVVVRAFEPGRDEDAWLAVNAAAFAHHPEQGRWTRADLEAREAESWFDPAGFFLALRGDRLLGFHWTKRHDAQTGEVYVVGVDPHEAGSGLGRSLTVRGLEHLRDSGVETVLLYVDEDNPRAFGMYERLGFSRFTADVTYVA